MNKYKLPLANISHHLQVMRDNGFFTTKRMGNSIYYRVSEDQFTKALKKAICDCKVLS